MSQQRLLDAFETNDVKIIKTQLALYAETEQRVNLQVKAREILAKLLGSNISEISDTIQEFRQQLLRKSSDIVVDLRQDVPEPNFIVPSVDTPPPPFTTPATTPSDSDNDEDRIFLIIKERKMNGALEIHGKIISAHNRNNALLRAIKNKKVTIDENNIAYDHDGYSYKIPDTISNEWMVLVNAKEKKGT